MKSQNKPAIPILNNDIFQMKKIPELSIVIHVKKKSFKKHFPFNCLLTL